MIPIGEYIYQRKGTYHLQSTTTLMLPGPFSKISPLQKI